MNKQIMPEALVDVLRGALMQEQLKSGQLMNYDRASSDAAAVLEALRKFGWEVRPRDPNRRIPRPWESRPI